MKKNAITVAFLFFSIILLTGCGGLPTRWEYTVKIDDLGDVPNGKARIVFFIPGTSAGHVLDATNDNLILLGSPRGGEGLVQDIEPGEYLFMVSSENADFMRATLEPNRTYYALVQWRFGVVLVRYGLWPIRNGSQGDYPFESERVQGWLRNIDYVSAHEKYLSFWGGEKYMRGYQKLRDKYWPKWQEKSSEDKFSRTLLPEDGISTMHYSKQNTQITQGVKTESNTVQPSIDDQEELQVLALENPESKKSVPSAYTSNLRVLMTLRDDGIISEDEFQKRKTEILASTQRTQTPLQQTSTSYRKVQSKSAETKSQINSKETTIPASTQRIQTPAQPKPRIREVDTHEIRYIVGDPSGQNHNSSTSGGVRKQHGEGVVSQSADKGTSKQSGVNQNDAKKTEWVREVGGKKFYCVRTTDQTTCR